MTSRTGAAGLGLALLASLLALALPGGAEAYEPKGHLYTANAAIAPILAGRNSVEIDGKEYAVPAAVANAIRAFPRDYRGGVIGPDASRDGLAVAPVEAGVWQGTALGGSVEVRHRDDGRVVLDDQQVYQGRFTFSFRVLASGRISGSGRGSYRVARWHMEGTNGDRGRFSCDPKVETRPFNVRVSGRVAGRRIVLQLELPNAEESNASVDCGAGFTAFGGTTTDLADSLSTVIRQGVAFAKGDPRIPVLAKREASVEGGIRKAVQHRWTVNVRPPGKQAQQGEPYIVVFKESVKEPGKLSRTLGRKVGAKPTRIFSSVLKGYVANLKPKARLELARDSRVAEIVPDRKIEIPERLVDVSFPPILMQPPQVVPHGVRRIGGDLSPTARIDGADERVPIHVAVIDTGLEASHPDLDVAGGKNCADGPTWNTADNGHGTHVAGTVAALDNEIGVVGVAPGARIWSVRVLGADGVGRWSWVICGLDFVNSKSPAKGGPIKVANLSLGGPASKVEGCDSGPLHRAVCRVVANGVTLVTSAGNAGVDVHADKIVLATYPEVINVTGLADHDGKPGGSADAATGFEACKEPSPFGGESATTWAPDDTFVTVWNRAAPADQPHTIAAPGTCILSTWPGGGYEIASGTSMAAPHVAGAAALYLVKNPGASPSEVYAALQGQAEGAVEPATNPKDPSGSPKELVRRHTDENGTHPERVLRASGL